MSAFFHVTARDHSAVILMSELARFHAEDGYRSLQEIAKRMGLSDGYLEEIAAVLKKAGLIEARQGPKGGYRLARPPRDISLEQILIALEGPVELVDCQTSSMCPVQDKCASRRIWGTLQASIQATLRNTNLAETIAV